MKPWRQGTYSKGIAFQALNLNRIITQAIVLQWQVAEEEEANNKTMHNGNKKRMK